MAVSIDNKDIIMIKIKYRSNVCKCNTKIPFEVSKREIIMKVWCCYDDKKHTLKFEPRE